ncbi:hypothetical protein KIN20_007897 [Parelaphostrongylus tenuis]|uniref:Uncharacterized protein n=1 Tax=Parelaphostrongylus tenuis TaxID=148309 RepID=A0AAD5QMC1_PARTN|nr:hypothetical protein KIN20_007897 [Parelaphostrongylus tenuis]
MLRQLRNIVNYNNIVTCHNNVKCNNMIICNNMITYDNIITYDDIITYDNTMNYIVLLIGASNIIGFTIEFSCNRSRPVGRIRKYSGGDSLRVIHTMAMKDISSMFDADNRLLYTKNPFANETCYDNEGNSVEDIGYVIGFDGDGKQPNRLLVSKIIDVRGAIHGDCEEDTQLSNLMLISSGSFIPHSMYLCVFIIKVMSMVCD